MRVSRTLRRLPIVAAATAALAPGAVAGARTVVEITGTASPAIRTFTLKPQNLSLSIDATFRSDVPGELPGTVRRATVWFPHGPRVNGRLFPSCNPRTLLRRRGARSACPRGSRIGGGRAIGTSPSFEGVNETLTVDLYNGPGGRSILFYLQGFNPVTIGGMINADFKALRGGRWGYKLTMRVPQGLQEISPGILASLLRFSTRVGATTSVREHGRTVRHGYIEAPICPPGALVPVRLQVEFRDGGSASNDNYVACGHR